MLKKNNIPIAKLLKNMTANIEMRSPEKNKSCNIQIVSYCCGLLACKSAQWNCEKCFVFPKNKTEKMKIRPYSSSSEIFLRTQPQFHVPLINRFAFQLLQTSN